MDREDLGDSLAFPAKPGPYPGAEVTAAQLSRRIDEQNARMVDAIARGITEGSIREVDPVMTATILWASWNGIISLAWRHDDLRLDAQQLAELLSRATDLVSYGLLVQ